VSLVVGVYGDAAGLPAFLASLQAQAADGPLELLLVDQNGDERVAELCRRHAHGVDWRILPQARPGLSAARNLGLAAATGEIVAFPDDDCLYPPDLLARVRRFFRSRPEYQVLTGCQVDPENRRPFRGFVARGGELRRGRLLRQAISFTIFARRGPVPLPRFDPALGLGGRFGSAEEADWLHRLLRAGARGLYDPALHVWHADPDRCAHKLAGDRYRRYGEGLGAYLNKHLVRRHDAALLVPAFAMLLARPLGGCLLAWLRGDAAARRRHQQSLGGRWGGFLTYDRHWHEQSRLFDR
jgi:glycosyltransferase involved in cell wall biosynthesis